MEPVIRHKREGLILSVRPSVPAIIVNDTFHEFSDIKEAELLCYVIEVAPNILVYDMIEEKILTKYKVAITPYSDSKLYIRKKKLSLSRFLQQLTGHENIIQNVRGAGYRLNYDWEVVDALNSIQRATAIGDKDCIFEPFLRDILTILQETIATQKRLGFIKYKDGDDLVLVLNRETNQNDVASLQERFQALSVQLMASSLSIGDDKLQQRVWSMLRLIFSYVSMSRQGANISESLWRVLFEKELMAHYMALERTLCEQGSL